MTTVTREHLAGLELVQREVSITSPLTAEQLEYLIDQASASPEQEVFVYALMRDGDPAICQTTLTEDAAKSWATPGYHYLPLYTHPSAEIDRLRAENKRLDLALAQADHNYDCDRQQFEQKLADAQALLRDALTHRTYYERHAMYDRIDAFLSAAQPADTGCSACACGSTEPHAATLGCIKAAGDAYHGKTAKPAEVKS